MLPTVHILIFKILKLTTFQMQAVSVLYPSEDEASVPPLNQRSCCVSSHCVWVREVYTERDLQKKVSNLLLILEVRVSILDPKVGYSEVLCLSLNSSEEILGIV
jgi:hypothetical protein